MCFTKEDILYINLLLATHHFHHDIISDFIAKNRRFYDATQNKKKKYYQMLTGKMTLNTIIFLFSEKMTNKHEKHL